MQACIPQLGNFLIAPWTRGFTSDLGTHNVVSNRCRWDSSHVIPVEFPENRPLRSKSEKIDEEYVQYYRAERCAEAGKEYDSEFK